MLIPGLDTSVFSKTSYYSKRTVFHTFNFSCRAQPSSMAATAKGGKMEVFPDIHHKMSKKIAQLTKVIYHLNTKNEVSGTSATFLHVGSNSIYNLPIGPPNGDRSYMFEPSAGDSTNS